MSHLISNSCKGCLLLLCPSPLSCETHRCSSESVLTVDGSEVCIGRRPETVLGRRLYLQLTSCFSVFQIIRQKILDLLNPLTAHLGVQLIAAVATVWSRKQARHHSKMKVRCKQRGVGQQAQCISVPAAVLRDPSSCL